MLKKIFIPFIAVFFIFNASCEKQEKNVKASPSGKFEFGDPWIRASAAGMNTALFFSVTNQYDVTDSLYKVHSTLAEISEIHETYEVEKDMLGMREIGFVEIKPEETFVFKPRSYHIMLIKLKNDLSVGDTGNVTLFFKQAGKIELSAPVREFIRN